MQRHIRELTHRGTLKRQSGYTLIEMLIASVLVAALMSVVWSMMSMYNGYLRAGQSQAVERQLSRSVLLLLEDDLQRVAIADTNPVVTSSFETIGDGGEDVTGDKSPETQLATSPQTDPFSIDIDEISLFSGTKKASSGAFLGRISLIGNSHSVRLSVEAVSPEPLHVAYPSDGTAESVSLDSAVQPLNTESASAAMTSTDDSLSIEGIAPNVPEFRTIIWQFEPFGAAPSGPTSLRSGLYRIEADLLSLETALSQQETLIEEAGQDDETSVDRMTLEALLFPPIDSRRESLTDGTEGGISVPQFDVIPEIVGCRFEYFNGSMWLTSWNSEQQLGLPLAVRIRLHLVTQSDLEKLNLAFGTTGGTDDLLDNALNGGATASDSAQFPNANVDPSATPFTSIPTRQIERIVILQSLTGPMPEPGALGDQNDAMPNSDKPPRQETLL